MFVYYFQLKSLLAYLALKTIKPDICSGIIVNLHWNKKVPSSELRTMTSTISGWQDV